MKSKDANAQFEFLNRFVKVFGFSGLNDYKTSISHNDFTDKEKEFLKKVNDMIPEVRKLYSISHFNLARKNYQVDNIQLAMCVLRKCMQISNVGFESYRKNNLHHMRIIPPNSALIEFIKNIEKVVEKKNK